MSEIYNRKPSQFNNITCRKHNYEDSVSEIGAEVFWAIL